jgi:hypothetical protein
VGGATCRGISSARAQLRYCTRIETTLLRLQEELVIEVLTQVSCLHERRRSRCLIAVETTCNLSVSVGQSQHLHESRTLLSAQVDSANEEVEVELDFQVTVETLLEGESLW